LNNTRVAARFRQSGTLSNNKVRERPIAPN